MARGRPGDVCTRAHNPFMAGSYACL
jgi:hypothetical protein